MNQNSSAKKAAIVVGAIVVVFALVAATHRLIRSKSQPPTTTTKPVRTVTVPGMGAATYFGNEVTADMNGDSIVDHAYLVSLTNAGSGHFYYLVADLSTKDGPVSALPVFLGDRIAPQTTEYRDGQIIVNYADRAPGEPMTAKPSVGVSQYFRVEDNQLVEVKK